MQTVSTLKRCVAHITNQKKIIKMLTFFVLSIFFFAVHCTAGVVPIENGENLDVAVFFTTNLAEFERKLPDTKPIPLKGVAIGEQTILYTKGERVSGEYKNQCSPKKLKKLVQITNNN